MANQKSMNFLHILACDAETITETLESFIASNNLDYHKMVVKDMMVQLCFLGQKMEYK